MGNYMSCSYIHPIPKFKSPKSARVVFPHGGEIRQFRSPTIAAELMLDCPDYFLANMNSLAIGRRFSPLPADEELELGNVYVMVSMRRLNSVVTAADVASFFMSAAAKSGPKRILSSPAAVEAEPTVEGVGGGDGRMRLGLGGDDQYNNKYRLSVCRSRRPGLDTIMEEAGRLF